MSLLAAFLAITADWDAVFPQQRTLRRAVRQALGSLVCLGRRCLTRIIWTNGGQDRSWSAEYFLHTWKAQRRLCGRYKKLVNSGKNKPRVVTAVGRELLGFIWAIAVNVERKQLSNRAA